jgi:hypothetical protein
MKKLLFLFLVPALITPCTGSVEAGYEIPLQESIMEETVLKGDSGMDLVTNYIALVYKYGASILGILCVLVIVISGIQIIMGGAQADFVTQAKTRIFQALLSLAILFLSAVILNTINPGFFNNTEKEAMQMPDTSGAISEADAMQKAQDDAADAKAAAAAKAAKDAAELKATKAANPNIFPNTAPPSSPVIPGTTPIKFP